MSVISFTFGMTLVFRQSRSAEHSAVLGRMVCVWALKESDPRLTILTADCGVLSLPLVSKAPAGVLARLRMIRSYHVLPRVPMR